MHAEDAACPFCGVGSSSAVAPLAMAIALGVALGACGPSVGVDDGSTGGTGTTTSAGSVTASSATAPAPDTGDVPPDPSVATTVSETATDTADVTSSSEDGVSGDEGCAFYGCPPDGGSSVECDVWAQDCPEGEKCMPWSNLGENEWNATRCSPVDPNGGAPGDPCTVEGNAYSGIDDCDLGSMCWNVDPNTNTGVCVANCSGSEANPECLGDEFLTCFMGYYGTIHECLPLCDPLVQDCGVGAECIPYEDGFVCVPDRSGDGGAYGDDCEPPDTCDPGLWCAPPDRVPGCVDAGCCTEFCDVDLPDPDTQCAGAVDGAACVPWFEDNLPPGLGFNLGTCLLPQ